MQNQDNAPASWPHFFGSGFKQVWYFVGLLLLGYSFVSVIALIQRGLKFGLIAPLKDLLELYGKISVWCAQQLEPVVGAYVDLLAQWFDQIIPHSDWWFSLFTPMWLYSVSIAIAVSKAHKSLLGAIGLSGLFLLICMTASLLASGWPPESDSSWPVLSVAMGFTLIALLAITWHALAIAPHGQKALTFLKFCIAWPVANLIAGAQVILVACCVASWLGMRVPFELQLVTLVGLMSLRDIAAGMWGATYENITVGNWLSRFKKYATTVQGMRALGLIVAAFLALAMGKGL